MYRQSQYDAWVIEVANYFVKNHKYQIVSMSKDNAQMWLVNAEISKNPIIMVTSAPINAIDKDILYQHRASLAMVFKTQAVGLNISVNQSVREGGIFDVVVGPNFMSESSMLDNYTDLPGMLRVSQNPDHSLTKAVFNLKKSITKVQKQQMNRAMPVTYGISVLVVAVFIVAQLLMITKEINPNTLAIMLGAFYKRFIIDGQEWFRFITAGFLHISFFHVLMNLIALRNLGMVMEPHLGWKKYLFTLLAGIILGNAFVFILDEAVIGLGLSGGLFALLGAMIIYLFETNAMRNPTVISQVVQILIINLFISTLPGVSGSAHFGGLIAGVMCGLMFSKRKDWSSLRQGARVLSILFLVGVAFAMSRQMDVIASPILDMSVVNQWYELGFKSYANRLSGLLVR